ncbi:hypothetical protein BDAP_001870 [Binucleata daphniae]
MHKTTNRQNKKEESVNNNTTNNEIDACIAILKSDYIIVDDIKNTNKIDYNNVFKFMKKKVISKIITRQLNKKSKRIYNLVVDKKYVEDKDVVKYGLVENKESIKILFDLYQLGYIRISYITRENKQVMVWEADDVRSCMNAKQYLLELVMSMKSVSQKNSQDVYLHMSDTLNIIKELFIVDYM